MTIVFCTHNAQREGAPIFAAKLATQFQSHGWRSIILSAEDGPLANECRDCGVEFHVIKNLYKNYVDRALLKNLLQREEVDVMMVNTILGYPLIPILKKGNPRLPVIWTIHESEREIYHAMCKDLGERHFAMADVVTFVAKATQSVYGDIPMKKTCIHNGIDVERIDQWKSRHTKSDIRKKYSLPQHAQVLLTVGTICPRKGQMETIDGVRIALNHLPHTDLNLVMVGQNKDGDSHAYAQYVRMRTAKDPWVRIFPETKDIYDFYCLADMYVCNSFIESFPLTILEAMAFELPIIASCAYGITEQVDDGENGLLILPGNAKQLSEAIVRLTNDPALAKQLGEKAYEKVRREFTEEKMFRQYEELIQSLMTERADHTSDPPVAPHTPQMASL